MSEYIVSARKYRPENFATLIGQDNIAVTLKNSILRGQLAHAYLFCGPRGVGKTTTARIFAKMINCSNPSADMEPCGECESCRSFAEGRSYCIHELDAASNNGVEDIKTLIDQVRVAPQVGKYSVYIIDEVHMLSQAAFNAFLKTLEEPPAHAIFILATTEKHKILPTILSRCQTYDFNRITVDNIVRNLRMIADRESVTIDDESLHVIAQKADGAMRDALTIFDQTVAFCGNAVKYEDVLKNLNVLSYEHCFALVEDFLKGDYPAALLKFDAILAKGFNALHFVAALSSHFRNLLVSRTAGLESLLELPDSLKRQYAEQAMRCSVKFLYDALAVTSQCESGYRASVNPRLHIEFALMKLSFLLSSPAAQPAAQPAATPVSAAQPAAASVPAAQPAATPVSAAQPAAPQPAQPAPAAQPAAPQSAPAVEPSQQAQTDSTGRIPAAAQQPAAAPAPAATDEAPRRRRRSAGFSLGSMLSEDAPAATGENADERMDAPERDEILAKWRECAEIFSDKPRLSNAIANSEVEIEDNGDGTMTMTFKVANDSQVSWIRSNALSKLQLRLNELLRWSALKLDVGKVESQGTLREAYTPDEKLAVMANSNPELRKLMKDVDGILK